MSTPKSLEVVTALQGAEFLADPCVVRGCIYSYEHEGAHEIDTADSPAQRYLDGNACQFGYPSYRG
jgi:hypothetical protein